MVVVVACGGALLLAGDRSAPPSETLETDNAVMIDLPPAEASSNTASDAADGPEQQAAPASPAQAALDTAEPPKPPEDPKPAAVERPVQGEPPPTLPDPPAVLEREPQHVTPPMQAAAPARQAQDERAPAGSQTPAKTDMANSDEGHAPPSAHAITLWQKALMKRLEAAKRQVGQEAHPAGTVKIAFEIDAGGGLASERVAQSSGSAALDKAALFLVRRAAPFPAPPNHATGRDTSFIVPVRFR